MNDFFEYEFSIDENKIYKLPAHKLIRHKGKLLIIFPNVGKWIVLENDSEYDIFLLLHEISVADILKKCGQNEEIYNVISQLNIMNIESNEIFEKKDEVSLHLYLTNACNLRCPHCYMNAGKTGDNELTYEEIYKLLVDFASCGGKSVTLSGGEISLCPYLSKIVKHAYDLNLKIDLLTNGTLWNDKLINEVAPYIDKVQVSIDGFNEEQNSKVRGSGNYAKAIWAMEQFLMKNVRVEVAVTPLYDEKLKYYIEEYANFGKSLLKKYGSEKFSIKFTGEIFDGRDIKFSKSEQEEYMYIAKEIYKRCFGFTGDDIFINAHRQGGVEGNCSYGNLTIAANGDVYFCSAVHLMKPLCNIRNISFNEIFRSSIFAKSNSHASNLLPCKKCDLRLICGGECRVKHFEQLKDCKTAIKPNPITRQCSSSTKEYYYSMMIRSNIELLI